MKYKYFKLIFLLIFLIFLCCWLVSIKPSIETFINVNINEDNNEEFNYGKNKNSKIPKKIWTFWEGKDDKLVNLCIESWKYYNPDYEVVILNKQNYLEYIDTNVDEIKHSSESLARYSDYIRLLVLSKYGGIWIDSSIICHSPFTWINGTQNKTDCEFIGYYIPLFTEDEYLYKSPVVESWFFACVPNSNFVNDWCNEFLSTKNYEDINYYIENVKNNNTSVQQIGDPNYLAIHVSAQKVLQDNMNDPSKYNIVLFSAYGPFKYLIDNDWDPPESVKKLLDQESYKKYHKYPIIKLRACERKEVDDYDDETISHMFSNPIL